MDCWLYENCQHKHCDDPNGCLIIYKLNKLFDAANVSMKNRKNLVLRPDDNGTDLDEFRRLKSIQDNIIDFVNNGQQLYIHSRQAGNGKTSWSLKLMQTYFKKIWLKADLTCHGLFINVPSLIIDLRDNITNKNTNIAYIKENIEKADLVIWDDIGTKTASQFEHDNLLAMIEKRINSGKSNIFTSNLNDIELHDALGDRLASRISNYGLNVEFNGGDKRGIN